MSTMALHLADYMLTLCQCGDMSHVKLEKLCAYAQAHVLALGYRLFDESLLAYKKGPVIPSIFECYKGPETDCLPRGQMSMGWLRKPYNSVECLAIELCASFYGPFSPGALVMMSHKDFPCPGAWGDKSVIPDSAIAEKFRGNPLTLRLMGDKAEGERDYAVTAEATQEARRVLGL